MRFPSRLLLLLGCLILSSCFDIREEIWIEADGSGRAELEYVIPTTAFALAGGEQGIRETIEGIIDSEPDLRLDELETARVENGTRITLKTSTDSMLSLIDMQESEAFRKLPETASDFVGSFDVGVRGLNVEFRRRIELQQALGLASLAINGTQRSQRQLIYIIHLPNQLKTHNATETSDHGRTLIWKHTLGEALSSPIETRFEARIPIPWWLFALFAALVSLLGWSLAKAWRRRRMRRAL